MRKINYHFEKPSVRFSITKNQSIDLGVIIRNARKKNFMTQQEVADESDISLKLYQKYEYNICRPSLETVFTIFNLLDVSLSELQQKFKSDSPWLELNSEVDIFSSEEFARKVISNPYLFKINEVLLKIECPECLKLISNINTQFGDYSKSELKEKLILINKMIK